MDYKTISVGVGLGFTVTAAAHDRAQRAANETNIVHFIGVLADGTEVEGTDRLEILALGAQTIAWVLPEWIPQPPAPTGEISALQIINAALGAHLRQRRGGVN